MEPDEYKILVAYKLKGEYPALFTKKEKFLLRRKAAIYDIEGNNSNFVAFINVINTYILTHIQRHNV